MVIAPQDITAHIEAELRQLDDPRILEHIRRLLVPPTMVQRAWDYGPARVSYPCWTVLAHPKSGTGIAYCASGFGPDPPWGLDTLDETRPSSMGEDSGWFRSFLAAFFDSAAITDLPIWRVFARSRNEPQPGTALTEEASWRATWDEVYRLRALASDDRRFDCECLPRLALGLN